LQRFERVVGVDVSPERSGWRTKSPESTAFSLQRSHDLAPLASGIHRQVLNVVLQHRATKGAMVPA
jgi:hypothetical protein